MSRRPDDSYEDLLGLWSDLEAALSVLLSAPLQVQGFLVKLQQIDLWLQELIAHDSDAALYLMFQRACSSTVGYSASHALVCACLCHVLARELRLNETEHRTLVRGALTMNIGMNALQDELALQREPLTPPSSRPCSAIRCKARPCWRVCSSTTRCGWNWWPDTMKPCPSSPWPHCPRCSAWCASWARWTATRP